MKSWVRQKAIDCHPSLGGIGNDLLERWFTEVVKECAKRARAGSNQFAAYHRIIKMLKEEET